MTPMPGAMVRILAVIDDTIDEIVTKLRQAPEPVTTLQLIAVLMQRSDQVLEEGLPVEVDDPRLVQFWLTALAANAIQRVAQEVP